MSLNNIGNSYKTLSQRSVYPRSEKIIIFAICASIAFPLIDKVINIIFLVEFWDSFFTKGIYYSSLILAVYYSRFRFKKEMIGIPLMVLLLFLFSYLTFPANRQSLGSDIFISLITISLPLFIITLAVKDYSRLYVSLRKASIIVLIFSFIYIILQQLGRKENGDVGYSYDMGFSYSISLSVLLLIVFAVQDKRKIDAFLAILGITIIFIFGARGAIVGILSGMVFLYIINYKLTIKKIIFLFISIFPLYLFVSNYLILLNLINKSLNRIHISSRTIQLIIDNEESDSSGRDIIFNKSVASINDNFILGTGMGGDRVIFDSYTHNLFTELLLQYGGILGSIFILFLVYFLIKTLFLKNRGVLYYFFIAVFFTTGFIKLQFSSSYLLEPTFFLMFALMIKLSNSK